MLYRIRLLNRESYWVAYEYGHIMDNCGLPVPKGKINQRARFYFTEFGWREVGRHIYAQAFEDGAQPKVIRIKNPKKSAAVYQDKYQVAILH